MLRIGTFYVPRTRVIFIINTFVKRFYVLNSEETLFLCTGYGRFPCQYCNTVYGAKNLRKK